MTKITFARYGSFPILAVALASCAYGIPPATQTQHALAALRRPAAASPTRKNGPIIICANTGSGWQVYRIDPDGKNLKPITHMPATVFDAWFPQVSRDGKRIAFAYGTGNFSTGFSTDVYVVNLDGSGLRRLTHDGVSGAPAWSPDGQRLILARTSPRTQRRLYLVSVPLDDPDQRKPLTTDLLNNYYGEYTPDGRNIIYNTQEGGVVSATWIMRTDGTGKRGLTPPGPAFCPFTISNDGKRILLQSNCDYFQPLRRSIWEMKLDDGGVRQLTEPPRGPFYDIIPSWSPDESKITFASNRFTPNGLDLFTMNSDGSNLVRIASGLTVGGCPDDNCVAPSWAVRVNR